MDWPGLAVAAWDSVWRSADGRRPRGGSTLTMQLAGLLEPALRAERREPRTLAQKWDQMRGGARDRARVDQGADPRGLPQPRRRIAAISSACARRRAAVRQGAVGTRRARIGDPGGTVARARRASPRSSRSAPARSLPLAAPDAPCEAIRARASVALAGRLSHAGARRRRRRTSRPSSLKTPGETAASRTLDGDAAGVRRSAPCAITCRELAARGVRGRRDRRARQRDRATCSPTSAAAASCRARRRSTAWSRRGRRARRSSRSCMRARSTTAC